ncbi:ribonuclease HII [Acetivibrio cellulolyticus]|uniref:ribonuclease HII n=1 Tax=Acetivibrio cellulolyticus TaxID=35830 RepID=UPI0001E2E775|nr:ribonuclease HII [Acetivibrio cellulolyticus]
MAETAKKLTLKQIEGLLSEMTIETALEKLYGFKEEYGAKIDKLVLKYEKRKQALEKELKRFEDMCRFEKEAYVMGAKFIAGIDEAGRGPLAGPVVAAAVILPENVFINGLNDSKKLSEKQREELYSIITEKAIAYDVGIVDEKVIDELNILNATKMAMEIAVEGLKVKPDILLIDAVKLDSLKIKQESIIKGDALSISIAAASIIAKVTRDRYIDQMDSVYPDYGFRKHKGYGTKEHIDAIKKFGICPIHRTTFTKNFTA